MKLVLNGEQREVPDRISVHDMLEHLELSTRRVAVEINLTLVPRSRHQETILEDGDRVEVVSFVGGG